MEKLETEFAQIVKEQKDTIYTVCYMFSKDAEEINDLFQEILVNLWKGFSSFRGQSHIKTWVWKVSLNTCISFDRKKRSRAQTIPLKMNINLYKDNDKDSLQIRMLYERVNRLGLFDRAIILLWLENLSYEEIGAIVGMPLGKIEHTFVMQVINMDMVMFGDNIAIISYLYGFIITLAFTLIVLVLMSRSLKKVKMVESLKSVE